MRCTNIKRKQTGFTISGVRQKGFTIVELMVATLVFSVILVIITTGIIYITKTYYKGVTLNKTQNVARSIINSVSQSIQFSGGKIDWPQPPPLHPDQTVTSGRGCIGNQAYDFQLGYQVSDDAGGPDLHSAHGLTLTPDVPSCSKLAGIFNPGPTELLSKNMRLSKFTVTPESATDNLYRVDITVVYGDYDLLCDRTITPATAPGGCGAGAPQVDPSGLQAFMTSPGINCRPGEGTAYCAVSALSTVVQQRLVLAP